MALARARGSPAGLHRPGARGAKDPAEANREAIANTAIESLVIPRRATPSYIAHNKFVVLLEDGEPREVWTGSTNMTAGGIFGQLQRRACGARPGGGRQIPHLLGEAQGRSGGGGSAPVGRGSDAGARRAA